MKYALAIAAAFVGATFCSSAARADSWSDYTKVMDRYYLIDKQESGTITCTVSSSLLDDILDKLPVISDIIAADLEKFRVSVRPDGTITFMMPRMRVSEGPPEAAAALSKALTLAVDVIKHDADQVLLEMVSRKREDLANLTVTPKGDTTVVSFSMKNDDGKTETHESIVASDSETTKEETDEVMYNSTSKYTKLDGKLAFSGGESHRTVKGAAPKEDLGPDGKKPLLYIEHADETTMNIKFQKVGKTYFPSRVAVDFTFKGQPDKKHMTLSFNSCEGP